MLRPYAATALTQRKTHLIRGIATPFAAAWEGHQADKKAK